MCDIADVPSPSVHDLMIVPWPQREAGTEAWAVVNRRGDILAVGAYPDCLRHLSRATATPMAA